MVDRPILVCVLASAVTPFDDNRRGVCEACGAAIQFRPYVPAGVRFMCGGCFADRMSDDDEIGVLSKTLDELMVLGLLRRRGRP